MPIIVCGINHKTAPVHLREKMLFSAEKLSLYLTDLLSYDTIQEAVILSTCNRSEVYCHAEKVEVVKNWFCQQHNLTPYEIEPVLYCHQDQYAVEHIMQVACGLDSMVLGEPQILGQMKEAFSESCMAGTVGPLFNRLFQQVFAVAKEVRTTTTIGACPVSVASTAVALARQLFPQMQSANVLAIGSGDTIQLALRHLKTLGMGQLFIANRNVDNAAVLAKPYDGVVIPTTQLANGLLKADIVISATGSARPIVTPAMFPATHPKKIIIIDIAVPRDVDPAVAALPFVDLYCIDDLKAMIQQNKRGREHAAEKAREVIRQKSHEFIIGTQSLDLVATTIRAYRQQIEAICHLELAKAARQLERGDDPLQVLTSFAYAFTNKLLHTPSVQLRQAGFQGRLDLLKLAQELFAISKPTTELL